MGKVRLVSAFTLCANLVAIPMSRIILEHFLMRTGQFLIFLYTLSQSCCYSSPGTYTVVDENRPSKKSPHAASSTSWPLPNYTEHGRSNL